MLGSKYLFSGLFYWKENEGGDKPRPGAVLGIRGSAKLLF